VVLVMVSGTILQNYFIISLKFTKMELFPGHIASLIPVLRETTSIHSIDLTSYNSYIFAKERCSKTGPRSNVNHP
ncbi:23707_t:CDS:1, partial [Racocetra persica]